jgi:ribosomal protein S10
MEDFISQDEFQLELKAMDEAIINMECDEILSRADRYGLQLEVVWSAFKHKEQFKNASFLECLQVGLNEWDL